MHDEIIKDGVGQTVQFQSQSGEPRKFTPGDIATLVDGMAEVLTGKQMPVTELETIITNSIQTEVDEVPDAPSVANIGGVLHFSKGQLTEAQESVVDYFKRIIEEGNENAVENYLWYLGDQEGTEIDEIKDAIRAAVAKKSAADLDFILEKFTVVLPLRSMAERQLIKREVRRQIENLPFTFNDINGDPKGAFNDPNGTPLTCNPAKLEEGTNDVEFVFVKEGSGFKLVIASKRGIGPVGLIDNDKLSPQQYPIDIDNIDIDPDTRKITLKLLPPQTGDMPLFSLIEIRREAILSLAKRLEEQENEMEKEDYQPQAPSLQTSRSQLSPRNTRPSSYVSVSH